MKYILASMAMLCIVLAWFAFPNSRTTAPNREDYEKIIREYLLENPEVIVEAIQELQERRTSEAAKPLIAQYSQWLYEDDLSTVMGNPDGTVTVVEFFDFQCGYCRRHYPVLKKLVAENPDLRIVFKQYPILDAQPGGVSHQAALAALYANSVGKGLEFHDALMLLPETVTTSSLRETAERIGLDLAEMDEAVKSTRISSALDSSVYVGREFRFDGTPSYIIGDRMLSGGVGYEKMMQTIEIARAAAAKE